MARMVSGAVLAMIVTAGLFALAGCNAPRVSREAEPLRHAVCGTPVEARWYCPTCERPVEGREAEEIRHV